MKHNLEVTVSNPANDGVVRCRKISIREKLMRLLFGDVRRMWIVIPDKTVEAVRISEVPEKGKHEAV